MKIQIKSLPLLGTLNLFTHTGSQHINNQSNLARTYVTIKQINKASFLLWYVVDYLWWILHRKSWGRLNLFAAWCWRRGEFCRCKCRCLALSGSVHAVKHRGSFSMTRRQFAKITSHLSCYMLPLPVASAAIIVIIKKTMTMIIYQYSIKNTLCKLHSQVWWAIILYRCSEIMEKSTYWNLLHPEHCLLGLETESYLCFINHVFFSHVDFVSSTVH